MSPRIFFAVMTGLLVIVAAVLVYLWPEPPASTGQPPSAVPAPASPAVTDPGEVEAEARRARVSAAFDDLAAARGALQRKLGDLKALTWGRELPAAQARRLSQDMMSAQYLLKNPPLLGAFSDVEGVQAEQARVDAALARLREVEAELGVSPAPR